MIKMEPKTSEFNIIDNFTLESMCFLKKLQEFSNKSGHQINKNLTQQFNLILDAIEEIIDNDPELVTTKYSNALEISLEIEENVTTKFYCNFCKNLLVNNVSAIEDHMKRKHSDIEVVKTENINTKTNEKIIANYEKLNREFPIRSPVVSPPVIQVPTIPFLAQAYTPTIFSQPGYFQQNVNNNNPTLNLSAEYLAEYTNVQPFKRVISELIPLRDRMQSFLNLHLKKSLLPVQIFVYGSRALGLANKDSDFNFGIKINEIGTRYDPIQKIKAVAECLNKHMDVWRIKRQNRNEINPSIEVKNIKLNNIICTFTFENELIYKGQTELVNFLFEIPIIRRVATLIKLIIDKSKINIKSYELSMLIIFYYQSKNSLPPIHHLQQNYVLCPPKFQGSWQVNFNTKCSIQSLVAIPPDTPSNCLDHINNFCSFYLNFDFSNVVICPYLGTVIQKNNFKYVQGNTLPRYHDFFLRNPKLNELNMNSTICIQDPIEQNVNLTIYMSLKDVKLFKDALKNNMYMYMHVRKCAN